uniref:Integral membrane protein n=1 Tax=Pyricularia grisea TaxID=148305 RepID=Q9Y784_PYRGI|nr:integral membrane protein [Pyricularia grisea]
MVAFTRLLLATAALICGAASVIVDQQTLIDIVTKTPACAMPCFTNAVISRNCSLASAQLVADCICVSNPTLSVAATCVQKSCKWKEQLIARNLTLFSLCKGYPIENRSADVINIAIIGFAVTVPVVIVRILSRLYSSGRLWWDDYTCLVASVFLFGMLGMQLESARLGFGKHIWVIDEMPGLSLLKYFWFGQMMYIVVQVFGKISILILYIRLFTTPWFQMFWKLSMVFMALHGVGYMVLVIVQCLPVAAVYDRSIEGKCMEFNPIVYSGAALSVFEDVVLVVIPIPELWSLRLNFKKKMGLMLMFAIGLVATVTSIVRINYLVKIGFTYDQPWDNVDPITWSVIEEFCAIICGSLPSCRAIVNAWIPRIWSSIDHSDVGNSLDVQRDNAFARSEKALGGAPQAARRKRFSLYRLTTEIDPLDLDFRQSGGKWKSCPSINERDSEDGMGNLEEITICSDTKRASETLKRRTEIGASPDDPDMVSVPIHSPGEVVEMSRRASTSVLHQSVVESLVRYSMAPSSRSNRSFSVIGNAWVAPDATVEGGASHTAVASDVPDVPAVPDLPIDRLVWPLPSRSVTSIQADAEFSGPIRDRLASDGSINTELGMEAEEKSGFMGSARNSRQGLPGGLI